MWWALIRKELREIAPFAAAGVVYCLLVVLALHSSTRDLPSPLATFGLIPHKFLSGINRFSADPSFCDLLDELLFLFSVLFLLGIGLRQTLGEDLKRTYPLLLHRPMGRNSIFLAKIAAALSVYLFLTLSVILILAIDYATPGHYSYPFMWEVVFGSLTVPLGGVLFYLTVFLTGLRRERWYGTRWLPGVAGGLIYTGIIGLGFTWPYLILMGSAGSVWILFAIRDQIWKREF